MQKTLSYTTLFAFIIVLSCNDADSTDDIPAEPRIKSASLKFSEGLAENFSVDSLKLSFQLSDGNFDLGLNWDEASEPPFHDLNFFLINGNGIEKISSKRLGSSEFQNYPVLIPGTAQGKVATYEKLSSQDPSLEYHCAHFRFEQFLVESSHQSIIDNSYNILDTLSINSNSYYFVWDSVKTEINENTYNIMVDYLVEQPDGSFEEFDWMQEFCVSTFHGRFPELDGMQPYIKISNGPFSIFPTSSKGGIMTYSMTSIGFKYVFGGKKVRLRFFIRDRSLNQSNVMETETILIPSP